MPHTLTLRERLMMVMTDAQAIWFDLEKGNRLEAEKVINLIKALAETANGFAGESADSRSAAALAVWNHFDKEWNIVGSIDRRIKLPGWLEWIDAMLLRFAIRTLIRMLIRWRP